MSVPKLRFPEFWDAGEWEEKKLIDVTDKKIKWSFIGGPFGSNLKSSDYTTQGIRVIQLQNIGDAEFLDNYKIFTSEQKANELLSCNIYPDEIILSKMGDPVGRACLIPHKHKRYLMCSDGIRLVIDEQLFSKYFIYSLINSDSFRKLLEKTATGSTRKRIGLDDLRNLPMVLPTLPEQQKIADCLTSLDDRITAETQKLDTLKAHKKGLMQQLFPAEGETLPKLRFPEFQDAGEWEVKALQSFCKVGDIDHKMPSSVADGIPYIMTGDFCGINNINFDNAKKISTEDYEQLSKKIRPEFGDIVIARYASVGAVRYIETNIKFLVSYSCAIIKCDKSQNSRYLYYVFQSDIIQSNIGLEINMSSQKNIGIDSIKKLNIFLPTLPEQKKIADCLTSIDEAIAAQSQAIELLKSHKKGLMQQLFPSVEEVKV